MSINWEYLTNECIFHVEKVSLVQQKKSEKSESYFVKVDLQNGRIQFRSFLKKIVMLGKIDENT